MTGPPSDECHADAQEEDEQEEEEGEEEEDEGGVHFYDSNDDDSYNPRDVEESSSSSDEQPPAKSKVGAICAFLVLKYRRISTIHFFRAMATKGYTSRV